mmetsp:Transcript_62203/g.98204  ORF Transcript_62203/g.98204 Transcript_62203/m.98204 type:complete len:269 (+) Transcript_62203:53-859(+)
MGDARKIFVGKLPADIREAEMEMIFRTYGRVEKIYIMDKTREEQSGEMTKAGFVTYEKEEGARIAIRLLDNVYRFRPEAAEPITCSIAKSTREDRDKGGGSRGDHSRSGDSHDRYDSGGSRGSRDRGDRDRGYSTDAYERDRSDRGGYDRSRNDRGDEPPCSKIYVANLPGDIREEAMDMVFGTYGRVEDIHIMTGRSKTGQAAAFVRYRDAHSARAAIAAMAQGYEIRPGEGNIHVRYADDRKKGDGRGRGDDGGRRDEDSDRSRPY